MTLKKLTVLLENLTSVLLPLQSCLWLLTWASSLYFRSLDSWSSILKFSFCVVSFMFNILVHWTDIIFSVFFPPRLNGLIRHFSGRSVTSWRMRTLSGLSNFTLLFRIWSTSIWSWITCQVRDQHEAFRNCVVQVNTALLQTCLDKYLNPVDMLWR